MVVKNSPHTLPIIHGVQDNSKAYCFFSHFDAYIWSRESAKCNCVPPYSSWFAIEFPSPHLLGKQKQNRNGKKFKHVGQEKWHLFVLSCAISFGCFAFFVFVPEKNQIFVVLFVGTQNEVTFSWTSHVDILHTHCEFPSTNLLVWLYTRTLSLAQYVLVFLPLRFHLASQCAFHDHLFSISVYVLLLFCQIKQSTMAYDTKCLFYLHTLFDYLYIFPLYVYIYSWTSTHE